MAARRRRPRRASTASRSRPRHKSGKFKKYLTPAQRRASAARKKARLKVFKSNIHKGWSHVKKALKKHSRSVG